jgi:hypothetical protein
MQFSHAGGSHESSKRIIMVTALANLMSQPDHAHRICSQTKLMGEKQTAGDE